MVTPDLKPELDREEQPPQEKRLKRWRRAERELEDKLERSFTVTVPVAASEGPMAAEAGPDGDRMTIGESVLEALIVTLNAAPRTAVEADNQLELAMGAARWLGSITQLARPPRRGTSLAILHTYASRDLAAVREIVTALRSAPRPAATPAPQPDLALR